MLGQGGLEGVQAAVDGRRKEMGAIEEKLSAELARPTFAFL